MRVNVCACECVFVGSCVLVSVCLYVKSDMCLGGKADPNQAASLFCSHHAHAASTLHTHTHTFHIHTPPLDHLQREGEIGEAGGGNEGVRGVELVRPGRRTCGFSMCSTVSCGF